MAVSRNVGRKKAMEMLMTGDFISAAEAESEGLINRAVPIEELDATVDYFVESILAKSPISVRMGKRLFYEQLESGMNDAYVQASDVMVRNMLEDDAAEGFDAFLEKRQPDWKTL